MGFSIYYHKCKSRGSYNETQLHPRWRLRSCGIKLESSGWWTSPARRFATVIWFDCTCDMRLLCETYQSDYWLIAISLSFLPAFRRRILSTNVESLSFDAALRLATDFHSDAETHCSCGPGRHSQVLGLLDFGYNMLFLCNGWCAVNYSTRMFYLLYQIWEEIAACARFRKPLTSVKLWNYRF